MKLRTTYPQRGPNLIAARVAALFLCAFLAPGVVSSQTEEAEAFSEEKRITAIDLVVAFDTGATRRWATERTAPKDLRPDSLEVVLDGIPRPVIAVEPTVGEWQIVVYFDAVLSSTAELKWAATTLVEKSAELTALGEVTVVVADPAPRIVLSPTRDLDPLNGILSQIAQTQEGQDEVLALRGEVVTELEQPETALDAELLGEVARGEARRIRERQDDLLLTLVDAEAATPHRLLLWVGSGFDLRPMDFYRPLIEQLPAPAARSLAARTSEPSNATDLAPATEGLARTLAAYGWVTVNLWSPEREVLKPGVRIGKFRLSGPGISYDEVNNRTLFKFFGATFEENRKPERAEAYLELGAALEGQGKLERAEESLRQAIYYFGGDPRTADRQASAFAHLSKVLAAQGKSLQATEARGLAHELDPDSLDVASTPVANLREAEPAFETVSRTTAGRTVRGAGALQGILTDLGQRVRLTYQVTGAPDGKLHPLEVRFENPVWRLRHPAWARSSIPESVAAARVRRLLAGELTGGELPLTADLAPASVSGVNRRSTVNLRLPASRPEPAAVDPVLRLTLGFGGPDVEPTVEHRVLGPQKLGEVWAHQAEVTLEEDQLWVAILVENLETGAWGGRLIERR